MIVAYVTVKEVRSIISFSCLYVLFLCSCHAVTEGVGALCLQLLIA